MGRLPLIDSDNEPQDLRPVFDQLRATRGRVPAMYRTLAHAPKVLAAHRAYFDAALDDGILPRAFKEKVAFKVAHMRGSAYSSASHRSYALRHGVPEAELEAVERGDYAALAPREAAALHFAEAVVKNQGRIDDATFHALAEHFTAAEAVEVVALIGVMEMASTYGAIFGLEAEAPKRS